jgi:hypothetical protein
MVQFEEYRRLHADSDPDTKRWTVMERCYFNP